MPDPLRRSWDYIYMGLAASVAVRGTCPRAQVGAVLVRAGRPLAVGYNGAAPGMPHCQHEFDEMEGNGFSCKNAIHAELNAIAWAARNGIPTEGATIYTTHEPCIPCGQAIVSAGIREVVYFDSYHSAYIFPDSMIVRQYPS